MRNTCITISLLSLVLVAGGGQAKALERPPEDLIAYGRYLTLAGDCRACHTAPGAALGFGGGYPLTTPVGVM